MDAATYYAQLAPLQVGQCVPEMLYIADYADGRRPPWTVKERADLECAGVRLLLVDPANADFFDGAAVIVITFPAKTVRTPVQAHGLSGPAIVGGKLCDLTQQGRRAQKESRS